MAFTYSNFFLLILIPLILTGCGKKDQAQSLSGTSNLSGTSSSNAYGPRWETDNISLKIADNFNSSQKTLIMDMGKVWEDAAGINFFNFSSTPNKDYTDLSDYFDNEMGIYRSSRWFSEIGSGALAINQHIGMKSGANSFLLHSDIIINDSGVFNLTTSLPVPEKAYDLPTIILHELGHFLGLAHYTIESSVMYPYLKAGIEKRQLTGFDVSEIQTRYQPLINERETPEEEVTFFYGLVELYADGTCKHYENGKLLYSHKIYLFYGP